RAQSLPGKLSVDGEPPHESGGQYRIARQFPGNIRRQIVQSQAARSERIISRDSLSVRRNRHKAFRNPPAHILTGLCTQIAIERFRSALEGKSVVMRRKRLDN